MLRSFAAAALIVCSTPLLFSQNLPSDRAGGPAQILTADDVRAVLTTAATALADEALAAARRA